MYPTFTLFGRTLGLYGIMSVLGFAAAITFAWLRARRRYAEGKTSILPGSIINMSMIILVGAMLGAVLLRPITRLPDMLFHWEAYAHLAWREWVRVLFGEIVFYGGLLGGIGSGLWFCRGFKLPIGEVADIVAPAIPLGHALGRIGCFFGGCCYGVHSGTWLDVSFPYGEHLPLQLFESVGNLILCIVLFVYLRKPKHPGNGMALYVSLYAAMRFTLEFWRGDAVRGNFAGLSTSQWIALAMGTSVAVWWLYKKYTHTKFSSFGE